MATSASEWALFLMRVLNDKPPKDLSSVYVMSELPDSKACLVDAVVLAGQQGKQVYLCGGPALSGFEGYDKTAEYFRHARRARTAQEHAGAMHTAYTVCTSHTIGTARHGTARHGTAGARGAHGIGTGTGTGTG